MAKVKKPIVTKKKPTGQKQKQIQKQNVTVNIGTTRAGKRTITKKKSQPQPPITVAPTFSPVFNKPSIPFQQPQTTQLLQPNPQSILSQVTKQQETPKIIKEDQVQTDVLRKALGEQQAQTDEPVTKANDLERVRSKRTEKFDIKPPIVDVPLSTESVLRSEQPVKRGLLSQLLGDQQDDTEEIQALRAPTIASVPYELVERPDIPSLRTTGTQTSRFDSALRSLRLGSVIPKLKGETLPPLTVQPQLEYSGPYPAEPEQPYPLGGTTQPTTAETFTETITEPTPLSQEVFVEPQLGFGGITEEVQTSIGEFLPPAPVAQTELLRRQQQEPPPSILEVRPPDAVITEVLVPTKGAEDVPVAEARQLETRTEKTQIKELWDQLVASGQLKASTKIDDRSRNKNKEELLADINNVSGYEGFKPVKQEVKNTGKTPKKAVAALDV